MTNHEVVTSTVNVVVQLNKVGGGNLPLGSQAIASLLRGGGLLRAGRREHCAMVRDPPAKAVDRALHYSL